MAITYVAQRTGTASSAAITLDLTGLGVAAGDIVVVVHINSSTSDVNPGVSTAGYTEIADLYADDLYDVNLSVSYKVMGATPDTSVATNNIAGINIALAYIMRGVDTTTPIDVTTTTTTGTNTGLVNSPSITPVTSDAAVLSLGGGYFYSEGLSQLPLTAPTGYGDVAFLDNVVTYPDAWPYVLAAWKTWTSGAEDPGAWAYVSGQSDRTDFSFAGVTVALRPAVAALSEISGTSSLTLTTSGTITGRLDASGSSSLTFTTAGTLAGSGALFGSSDLTFSPSGTLAGAAALSGASDIAFAASGTLGGSGALSASSSLTFAADGNLTGTAPGDLLGSASLTFTLSGTLADATPVVPDIVDTFDGNDGKPRKDREAERRKEYRERQERLRDTIRNAIDEAYGRKALDAPQTAPEPVKPKQIARSVYSTVKLDGLKASFAEIDALVMEALRIADEQRQIEIENENAIAVILLAA